MSTINLQGGNTLLTSGFFPPARVASTGSPLNPATGGLLTVDGIALTVGDRVLCKDETSAVNNGIYAAQTGAWVRTADASTNTQFFSGMAIIVALGAVNSKKIYICTCTDDPVVVGTSLITFAAQLPVGGGNVVGPASSTAGHVATYADGTGLLLADTAVTGSGSVVKATSPSLVTPTLGAATATSINNVAITQPASTATLTIASGKTLTASNSLTFAGTDGKTLTVNNSLTLAGTDGKTLTVSNSLTLAGNDGKTLTVSNSLTLAGTDGKILTVSNSLTLAGTDSTTMTFPSSSATVAGLAIAQTFSVVQTITPTQAANTSVDGLVLADTTAASSGNQQFSPRLRFTGQGWKTASTAASQEVDWIVENQPVQGSSAPTSQLVFSSQINGAGYSTIFLVTSAGLVESTGSLSVAGTATCLSATAVPSGGTTGSGFLFSSTANFGIFFGTGNPTLSAAKGSLYLENGTGQVWLNTSGSTTWTQITVP